MHRTDLTFFGAARTSAEGGEVESGDRPADRHGKSPVMQVRLSDSC
jgi:hypothetical protein